MTRIFTSLRNINSRLSQTINVTNLSLLSNTTLFTQMNISTKLLWEEGLYIDFIQNNSTDNLVRSVVIHTLNVFSERLAFDKLILTIPTLLVSWAHFFSVFELKSVSSLIMITLVVVPLLLILNLLNLFSILVIANII